MSEPSILVIGRAPADLDAMRHLLGGAGYRVTVVSSHTEALGLAAQIPPELILLDASAPAADGFRTCRWLKQQEATRQIPVVLLTARDDTATLVEGFQAGAVDCVAQPFRSEEVIARIGSRLEQARLLQQLAASNTVLQERARQLAEQNRCLQDELDRHQRLGVEPAGMGGTQPDASQLENERHKVYGFVGCSRAVDVLLEEVSLLRQAHHTSVLITGESGTGKEVIARAIHFGGTRAGGPFVAVNCAAVPRELAESSFFGHVRGAFTGAYDSRKGFFEQADGGTLFLDEVGDLPQELQAKLLRVLETGLVTPLGTAVERRVDVRILAATNQDLTTRIAQDRFREDLYFRLAGFTMVIPPLRERREDIPLLVAHLLRLFAEEMGRESPGLSREAMALMEAHEFPGNVRELRNLIEYALIRSKGALIRPEHLRFIELRRNAGRPPEAPLSAEHGKHGSERDEEQILSCVRARGSISNAECQDLLSVDQQRASYLLKKLHGQGLLERQGTRRWSRYILPRQGH